MSDVAERLLDSAERKLRSEGFHAVSFRELASELGIKSASVHYHFPKKADLGTAVVTRYAQRFFKALDARVAAGQPKLPAFIESYREALAASDQLCLCGVMGAEAQGLPDPVRAEVRQFLAANVDWLETAYREAGIDTPREQALHTVAAMQGAMLLAVNLGDQGAFDTVAQSALRAVRARARS